MKKFDFDNLLMLLGIILFCLGVFLNATAPFITGVVLICGMVMYEYEFKKTDDGDSDSDSDV